MHHNELRDYNSAEPLFTLLTEVVDTMRIATLFVLMGAMSLASVAAFADMPAGKVAVIRVTAIDGLAKANGPVTETRDNVFTFDGSTYTINSSAVGGLDGVQTLVLIDRRTDKISALVCQ